MSFTLSTGLMASNYAGNTKKSTANGLIFAGWAAGLIAGPRKCTRAVRNQYILICPEFFLDSQAPTFELAFRMLSMLCDPQCNALLTFTVGCYALMIVLPILQLLWYRYENNRRDRLVRDRSTSMHPSRPEFTDKTDFEQWDTFRYIM
jgi:ACS family allantoate permease-like MFS transporter